MQVYSNSKQAVNRVSPRHSARGSQTSGAGRVAGSAGTRAKAALRAVIGLVVDRDRVVAAASPHTRHGHGGTQANQYLFHTYLQKNEVLTDRDFVPR